MSVRRRTLGAWTNRIFGAAVMAVLVLHAYDWRLHGLAEALLWRLRYAAALPAPEVATRDRVLVVAIDDESLRRVPGRWPWNRRQVARLVRHLSQARVLGLDLFFANASSEDPDQDDVLAASLADHGRVVLVTGVAPDKGVIRLPRPYSRIGTAAQRVGAPVVLADHLDQVTQIQLETRGDTARGFVLELLEGSLDSLMTSVSRASDHWFVVTSRGPGAPPPVLVPVDIESRLLVDHRYLDRVEVVPAWSILEGSPEPGYFRDRVVLVGTTGSRTADVHDTPLAQRVPGVLIQAGALTALLSGGRLHKVADENWVLAVLALTGTMMMAGLRLTPGGVGLVTLAALGAWWIGALFLFRSGEVVIPLAHPTTLALSLGLLGVLRFRFRPLVEVVEAEEETDARPLSTRVDREPTETRRRVREMAQDPAREVETAPQAPDAPSPPAETGRRGAAEPTRTVVRRKGPFHAIHELLERGETGAAAELLREGDLERLTLEELDGLAKRFEDRADLETAERLYSWLHEARPDLVEFEVRLAEVRRRLARFTDDDLGRLMARKVLHRRYQDVQLVGRGGMGFVFRVVDQERDGRRVALKVLSPFHANDDDLRTRFVREAEILARLRHPNLVEVLDVYGIRLPYYSMELLKARNLRNVLDAEGRLPCSRVAMIGAQCAAGLDHAHQAGVVHRDVKPENVMVEDADVVKIIDFGIARVLDGSRMTQQGAVLGTLAYMAPEQAMGHPPGPPSDIWALGLVLHEAATGVLPAGPGEDPLVRWPVTLHPDLVAQPALRAIISRCLEVNPYERPGSMGEVEARLRDLAAGSGGDPA